MSRGTWPFHVDSLTASAAAYEIILKHGCSDLQQPITISRVIREPEPGNPFVKIFISYSRDDQSIADALEVGLHQEGHQVFFDKSDLPAGESFHAKIRNEIAGADAFVFLISPSSVRPESYAMTELGFARKRWPDPSGKVLPVLVRPTDMAVIPPYLTSNTFVQGGNIVAETIGAIAALGTKRDGQARARLRRRIISVAAISTAVVAAAWAAIYWRKDEGLEPQPCYLAARVTQRIGLSGLLLDTVYAGEANSFLTDGDGAASIHVGPLQTTDAAWIFALRSATGEQLARHELRGCPTVPVSFSLSKDIDVTLAPR